MTLHGAKGLEFPYVYLSGMEDGLFPSSMSIFSDDKDAIEEERRLCYVGITRAEKELTLTAARQRMVNGETRFAKVSRFIEEIPPQLLDEEEQPIVFERAAGMSRGRRGFEDSGTSGWTTGSFGVSGAGDGVGCGLAECLENTLFQRTMPPGSAAQRDERLGRCEWFRKCWFWPHAGSI